MSKETRYFLGIFLTIFLGSLAHWFFCCCSWHSDKDTLTTQKSPPKTGQKPPTLAKTATTYIPFSINAPSAIFHYQSPDNFTFKTSDFHLSDSVFPAVIHGLNLLKEFNDSIPQQVTIAGYYTHKETNNSAFPNLGLARATTVKNVLIQLGIPAARILTEGKLHENMVPDTSGIFHGPIIIASHASLPGEDRHDYWQSLCDSLAKTPIVLQFDTGRANIVLDSTQKKTFALLSNCIDKEQRNITVTGHTDNTGTSTGNTSLGLQRANFVRDYLIDNGILSQHIQALSKGQIQPKASNKTPEGRAQNRRIEVTIN